MEQHWKYRDYVKGDERLIIHLFKRVFGKEMPLPFWKWRFVENPYGNGIIKLMFDDDKLIGHYAVIPMSVQVAGTSVKAAFSMTTMTHPEYSGRGIFTFLAEEVYNACAKQGLSFVYGFPNSNSYPGFTQKLGWAGLGKILNFHKVLADESGKPPVIDMRCIESFDNRADLLWEKVKGNYSIIVPRVEKYLNWRFSRNPDVYYQKYILLDKQGQMIGYAILKQYVNDAGKKGHIVDMLSINDEESIRILIRHSCAYFRNKQIADVSGWFPVKSQYRRILEEEGFKAEETGQNFGVSTFDQAHNLVKSMENWYLTMGDSDVY